MAKSACLFFPFEEVFTTRSLRRAETVNDAIASSIRCFLLTIPGQRRGNVIGSFLSSLKHQLIQTQALDGLSDELKTELVTQFKGVIFTNVALSQSIQNNIPSLEVSISFQTPVSDITQLIFLIS
jgi:hypothetical protein